jgi:epoxyqueuosine reductase
MDEAEWRKTFGMTLLGLTMGDKKYLKRNAIIALGNFIDERSVPALLQKQNHGDNEVKEYAAWALGRIGLKL